MIRAHTQAHANKPFMCHVGVCVCVCSCAPVDWSARSRRSRRPSYVCTRRSTSTSQASHRCSPKRPMPVRVCATCACVEVRGMERQTMDDDSGG